MGVSAPPLRITIRALVVAFAVLGLPALGLAVLLDLALSYIPDR